VRRPKAELRARVNEQLVLRYQRTGLTSYAGLEFVRRWLHRDGIVALVRHELARALPATDYGVVRIVLVILALLLSGGRRLRHLRYLAGDPLVLRFCGLRQLPTAHTVGRWLAAFRARHLRLQAVNAVVAARAIRRTGQRQLTIDVDASVVSTGLTVAWAQRGFNPHRRKVPSYYPITAYEAQSGQIVRVQNREDSLDRVSAGFRSGRVPVEDARRSLQDPRTAYCMSGASLGTGRGRIRIFRGSACAGQALTLKTAFHDHERARSGGVDGVPVRRLAGEELLDVEQQHVEGRCGAEDEPVRSVAARGAGHPRERVDGCQCVRRRVTARVVSSEPLAQSVEQLPFKVRTPGDALLPGVTDCHRA
jgi:hypothetical protein